MHRSEKQENWFHGSFTVAAQAAHMFFGTPCRLPRILILLAETLTTSFWATAFLEQHCSDYTYQNRPGHAAAKEEIIVRTVIFETMATSKNRDWAGKQFVLFIFQLSIQKT